MPPCIPVWRDALARVNRAAPAPEGADVWPYWFPEPALVASPTKDDRLLRHFVNWHRARSPWIYVVTHHSMTDDVIRPLTPAQWREYLNTGDKSREDAKTKNTKKSEQKRQIAAIFSRIFGEGNVVEGQVPGDWFGRAVNLIECKDSLIMAEMLWELSEMGFRHELRELDRYLVPFVAKQPDVGESQRRLMVNNVFPPSRPFHMKELPTKVDGLAASNLADRVRYLDALRQIVCRWPNVPPSIQSSPSLLDLSSAPFLEKIEREMAQFYCQTFYEVSGRAAVLPRKFPLRA